MRLAFIYRSGYTVAVVIYEEFMLEIIWECELRKMAINLLEFVNFFLVGLYVAHKIC